MSRVTLIAATLFAACCTVVSAYAQQPIKIGAIISKTGPAAFLGEPQEATLNGFVKELNANGGVLGRPVELIIYDDATNANSARTFATRLIEDDKVVAAIGTSTTGGTLAIMSVSEAAKVPPVSLAAAIATVEPVKPYIFKTPHTDRLVCKKSIGHMKAQGYKNIALVTGTDGVGKSMRHECAAAAKAEGIRIIADETFNPKDVDMSPQLTRIKNTKGVDAVFVGGFGQSLAVVARNYRQLGLPFPQYHSHGSASKTFIELSEGGAEGALVTGPLLVVGDKLPQNSPLRPAVVKSAKAFTEMTGKPVSTFGGYSYDAILLITEAIKRAGSDKPKAIRDALEATKNLPGVTGMFNMSPTDHLGITADSLYMVRVKNGDWALAE